MGLSLCVYKINSDLKLLLNSTNKTIELTSAKPKQKEMAAFGGGNKLPQALTKIKAVEVKEDFALFKIYQESNTIKERIKVYKWDYLEEGEERPAEENSIVTDKGYQKIRNFRAMLDIKKKLLFVFTKKYDAEVLVQRLRNNEDIKIENYYLDLEKIDLIPEIVDEWGAWLDDKGEFIKKAYFSTQVQKYTKGEEEFVTTYCVTYNHSDLEIDLIISREGRISSNNRSVTNRALVKIFENIKERIESKEMPNID